MVVLGSYVVGELGLTHNSSLSQCEIRLSHNLTSPYCPTSVTKQKKKQTLMLREPSPWLDFAFGGS